MPPVAYTESMPDTCTYWPPAGNDGYGGNGYGAPVSLACRWQNVAKLFRDPQGREVVSDAIVYTGGEVLNKGKLFQGVSVADTPPDEAVEIRQVDRSPSLDGSEVLTKAYL